MNRHIAPGDFYGNKAGGFWDNRPPAGQDLLRFRNRMDAAGAQFSEDYFAYQVPQQSQTLSNIAPGASLSFAVHIAQDSAFEWLYTTGEIWNIAVPTGSALTSPNVLVQITDQTSSRNLFSAPIPWVACIGTGQTPFVLPIPRRFMAKTTFIITLTNFDPAITYGLPDYGVALCGRKIFAQRGPAGPIEPLTQFREWQIPDPESGRPRLVSEDLFAYVIALPSGLGGGTTGETVAYIEADSDFEWMMTTGYATDQVAPGTPRPWNSFLSTITFSDGGMQRGLQNQDLFGANVIGTANFPFILPVPRMFLAKSQLLFRLQVMDSGLGIINPTVVLWGRKIFELD